MKKFNSSMAALIAATTLAAGLTTSAEARQSTQNFTCGGVQDLVDRRGSVVLNTKNARVYKRFVRDRTQCAVVESTRRISVPTRDGGCSLRICYEPLERNSR